MKCSVISIDLAKNIFQICALDEKRQVLFNKKVKRSELLHQLRQFEPTLVVMEACYSSNLWGRRIEKLGHEVRLIPPFVVKPFVIGNKNDANDALAIAVKRLDEKAGHRKGWTPTYFNKQDQLVTITQKRLDIYGHSLSIKIRLILFRF